MVCTCRADVIQLPGEPRWGVSGLESSEGQFSLHGMVVPIWQKWKLKPGEVFLPLQHISNGAGFQPTSRFLWLLTPNVLL